MKHHDDARELITDFFQTGFVTGSTPFIPVRYENQPFAQPVGAPWAALTVQDGGSENMEIGTGFQRTIGVVYLQIFSHEDGGTKIARQAADKMAEILDNVTLTDSWGSVLFRVTSLQSIGKNREGWYQHNATCPFWIDTAA